MRQDQLKLAAIERGEDISLKGRKSQYPVYAYSLSWHPEQAPSREDMIEAATQSLKVNNLDKGYEVLMVSYSRHRYVARIGCTHTAPWPRETGR